VTTTSPWLRSVAAHGLAGSRTDLPAAPLDETEWFDLVHGCIAGDLLGFLATATSTGELPVTAGQADEMAVLTAEGAGLSSLLERRARTVASVLAAAGIDHRVIDGPARRLAYGGRGSRHFRVVHVLVSPDDLDDARALVGAAPPAGDGPAPSRHERVSVGAALPGGAHVDGPSRPGTSGDGQVIGEVAAPDILGRLGAGTSIDLGGHALPVLTLEQQLVVTCVGATTPAGGSLAQLRDVAQIALSPGLDGRIARRIAADGLRVGDALAAGIALAWSRFDLADKTDLSVWALRMGGTPTVRTAVRRAASHGGPAGLAQRVLGRRPAVPPGAAPSISPQSTTAPANGPGRSPRPTRRHT
jgi:hypothetical protein